MQTGSKAAVEDVTAEMTTHTASLVNLQAGEGSFRIEMKLVTDQAGAGNSDVVLSSHRAVHTRWGGFNKSYFSLKLICYSELKLAANITANEQQ